MLWQYEINSRRRYLFGAAAVTALMLATKETAYFVILFMGLAAMALGWRELWEFVKTRRGLAGMSGSAGFFVLLATLTLPQAAALIALVQSPLGLTIASRDTGSTGDTGAPVWEAPFVTLPLWAAPVWLHIVAARCAGRRGAGAGHVAVADQRPHRPDLNRSSGTGDRRCGIRGGRGTIPRPARGIAGG